MTDHYERPSSVGDDKTPLLNGDTVDNESIDPVLIKGRSSRTRKIAAAALVAVIIASICTMWSVCKPSTNGPVAQDTPANGVPHRPHGIPEITRETLLGDTQRWLGSNRNWDINEAPTTRYFNWSISEVLAPPGSIYKYMIVVNGMSPAPTIEANVGDKIAVTVHNHLKHDATSIHWHGMWQRGTNFYDGTMSINGCGIPPGKSATYEWNAMNMGTAWYHSHRAMQYTDGLYGPIIIHSNNEPAYRDNHYDDELTLMVGDIYNTRVKELPIRTTGRRPADSCPDGASINGHSQAKCAYLYPTVGRPGVNWCGNGSAAFFEQTLVGGNTYRIRLVNHGTLLPLTFSIDKHEFKVIEADGVSVVPYPASTLSLDVGHRYSILVTLDQEPGAYWMRVMLEAATMVFPGPYFNSTTLGILRYEGYEGEPENTPGPDIEDGKADAGPQTNYPPAVPLVAPISTVQHVIEYGIYVDEHGESSMGFNKKVWRPLPDGEAAVYRVNASNVDDEDAINVAVGSQYNIVSREAAVIDLIFNAPTDTQSHPMHLHGHSFWIMSQGPGPFTGDSTKLDRTNPMRRDTFVVAAHGHTVIRLVADNPGVWPLHCHVAWHLEGGLLMTFTSLPREMLKFDIPEATKKLCYAQW